MKVKQTNQQTQMIALRDLKMAGYQRSTNNRQVKRITKDFDEARLGFLIVSHRDGQYFLLDGAHRAAALRQLEHSHADCIVIDGMSYEEEAEYFRTQNINRRPLSQYDYFKAGLEAKDELYVKINAIAGANGFTINSTSRNFNVLKAINALKTVAVIYGYENLDATLRTIRNTWNGILLAVNREFIVSAAEFINRYGQYNFTEQLKDKPGGVTQL